MGSLRLAGLSSAAYCVLTLTERHHSYHQPCYTVTNPCTAFRGLLSSLTAGCKSSAHLSPSCQAVWVAVRLFSPPPTPSLHRPAPAALWKDDGGREQRG